MQALEPGCLDSGAFRIFVFTVTAGNNRFHGFGAFGYIKAIHCMSPGVPALENNGFKPPPFPQESSRRV